MILREILVWFKMLIKVLCGVNLFLLCECCVVLEVKFSIFVGRVCFFFG